jgi:CHAD domain-containing protein
MALDAKTIGKPFRKLRKLLKDLPDPPAPEDVHEIRTHTRRIEAIVGAVQLDEKSPAKLLERLKPIRKAAGKVRDMDVFIDLAASIQPRSDSDCRLKLIHHLSRQRTKAATRLVKRVDADDKQIRADLKKCASAVDSDFDPARSRNASNKQRQQTRSKAVRSIASSLEIEEEMRHWPRLTQQNIHPFRLKVKQLRYTLQLAEESESKFIDALGQVKDQIGQWHDWNELAAISAKVLDRGSGCDITARIRARAKQELQKALEIADALRTQYLRIAQL